jgi:hypothetical protein
VAPVPALEAPAEGRPAGEPPAPFYIPTIPDLEMAPHFSKAPPMVALIADTHDFVSGSIRGFGDETRIYVSPGDSSLGFLVGTFNFDTFGVGIDVGRYWGRLLSGKERPSDVNLYLLVPNIDARFYFGSDRMAAVAGTSVTGLRVATCALLSRCAELSLRVATLDFWYAGDNNQQRFAFSVGGSLTAGIKL